MYLKQTSISASTTWHSVDLPHTHVCGKYTEHVYLGWAACIVRIYTVTSYTQQSIQHMYVYSMHLQLTRSEDDWSECASLTLAQLNSM